MEQELEIVNTGKTYKDGSDIKNITLKTRVNKATGDVQQGLKPGNHIEIVKEGFAEGRKVDMGSYAFYSCTANYKGEKVTFILNEKEHADFASCGGVGDRVKLSMNTKKWVFQGKEGTSNYASFELLG